MTTELLVPYWGSPELMILTVDSVLAQDEDDWLLTVVDDGYPDPAVRDHLAGLDDARITYRRNERNLGISGNFQRCLDVARGDVVTFLGSDDLLEPGYVRRVRECLELQPDASMVQPGVTVVDGDGAPAEPLADRVKQRLLRPRGDGVRLLRGEALASSLMVGDWLYWPSLAFRREALAGRTFRPEYEVVLDLALIMQLVVDGHGLALDDTPTFRYRRHDASVSAVARATHRFVDERTYFSQVAAELDRRGWPRAARAARLHLTSRLHAATLAPGTLARRDLSAAGALLRHLVR